MRALAVAFLAVSRVHTENSSLEKIAERLHSQWDFREHISMV